MQIHSVQHSNCNFTCTHTFHCTVPLIHIFDDLALAQNASENAFRKNQNNNEVMLTNNHEPLFRYIVYKLSHLSRLISFSTLSCAFRCIVRNFYFFEFHRPRLPPGVIEKDSIRRIRIWGGRHAAFSFSRDLIWVSEAMKNLTPKLNPQILISRVTP